MTETNNSAITQHRRKLLATVATLTLAGCAGSDDDRRTEPTSSTTTTATPQGRRSSPTTQTPTPEPTPATNQTKYAIDRPVHRPGFPTAPPALIGDQQTEIVQSIRSQNEWERLLRWANEDARTAFTNYEFVTRTAFDRELVLLLQVRTPVGASLRLLGVDRHAKVVKLRADWSRRTDRDGFTVRYLLTRVPKSDEPLQRVVAEFDPNGRRLDIVYHPPPCRCENSETDQ